MFHISCIHFFFVLIIFNVFLKFLIFFFLFFSLWRDPWIKRWTEESRWYGLRYVQNSSTKINRFLRQRWHWWRNLNEKRSLTYNWRRVCLYILLFCFFQEVMFFLNFSTYFCYFSYLNSFHWCTKRSAKLVFFNFGHVVCRFNFIATRTVHINFRSVELVRFI